MVKDVFSNTGIEDENLLSVFSPIECTSQVSELLDFNGQQEQTVEEMVPSVSVKPLEPKLSKFWCPTCGKPCVSNKRLKQHKESHSSERPHECKVCGLRFKRVSDATKHMKIHNDSKKFSCQFCQFKTVHKFALEMHIKRHFGEYKFKCDICDKGFYTKSDLTNHTITHSGDRPYQCHICKLTFLYKNNLLYHRKTIHPDPDTAVEYFQCGSCEKTYQSKRSLLTHFQKRHAGSGIHLCEICGLSMLSGNALKIHKKKMHSKAYPCKLCSQMFDNESSLKTHSNSHSKVK